MTLRCAIILICASPWVFADSPCIAVKGDHILGSDLSRALPDFAHIPPKAVLSPSPLPGSIRTFTPSEMQSFAARFSVSVGSTSSSACFQLEEQPLDYGRVESAMRSALNVPGARIEVVEISPATVPVGEVEFARDNLGTPAAPDSNTPVPWRGDVLYAGSHRFPVLAKVRITAPISKLVATEALRPGVAITASQVRTQLTEGFPSPGGLALSPGQVTGLMPLRPLPAGGEVRLDSLVRPNDVNRGDLVDVEVQFGAAHLSLTGRAESGGRIGDMVAVRNPDTSKIFQALIEGVDRVIVGRRGNPANSN